MINKVLRFIDKYQLSDKRLIVGFSGGPDSMSLLNILHSIRNSFDDKYKFVIIAAHYNHNWRGETAKEEQEKCRKFCNARGIEFYTETASDNIKKNETEARELRYAFFERTLGKYNADAVLTAHNWDDNAETILYRIIKGTGVVGLKGILPKRGIYYRPFLDVTRFQIEEYCEQNNLNPNIDYSNMDIVHKRNFIRQDILPLLAKINPDVKKSLNSLGKIAISESAIIDEYIEQITKKIYKENKLLTSEFIKLSDDVKQKIIYNLIYQSEFDYTFDMIANICNFIDKTVRDNKPSKFSLDKNSWLYVDKNIIEIISKQKKCIKELKIESSGEYKLADSKFTIEPTDKYFPTGNEYNVYVDLSKYNELILRTRRDGDIIQPIGCNGKMKLKKYLMSKNIPQHIRDKIILLVGGGEILWVAGIGMSDKIKVVDKPTHKLGIIYKNGELL